MTIYVPHAPASERRPLTRPDEHYQRDQSANLPDFTHVDWNGHNDLDPKYGNDPEAQRARQPLPGSQSAAERNGGHVSPKWAVQANYNPAPPLDLPPMSEAAFRKEHPMATGVLDYFPDALMEIAHLSKVGNDQHNPGQPLHWAKGKSQDHADALLRHLKDRGTRDTDGERHWAKVAWRALAGLQTEIENERKSHYTSESTTLNVEKENFNEL